MKTINLAEGRTVSYAYYNQVVSVVCVNDLLSVIISPVVLDAERLYRGSIVKIVAAKATLTLLAKNFSLEIQTHEQTAN